MAGGSPPNDTGVAFCKASTAMCCNWASGGTNGAGAAAVSACLVLRAAAATSVDASCSVA
jgi:hypothetical protein